MESLKVLLDNNQKWAAEQVAADPEFFARLAKQQAPEYLWIGCSDSRVPANQITGLAPGEVFVHRNIANVVVQTDMNMLSVVQFAVDVLKVKHIIVCGHYGCGGVKAALDNQRHGLIDNWLRHIKTTARVNEEELSQLEGTAKIDRLCELNVLANACNVSRTTIVEDAWSRGQQVDIHSWIYRLDTGLISAAGKAIRGPGA
ncbi:carbonate dehydratase [Haloferula sargassicola]|uniref:Carbonic anhydrase n=1 Tax=Haloferula sargassicola TaxID=490096 RepID=A0ABP9UX38_9BACT